MKTVKIIISAVLAAAVLTAPACRPAGFSLTVGGSAVSPGLYAYFLSEAYGEAKGPPAGGTDEWIKNRALELCRGYVAVNKKAGELEIKLNTEAKLQITADVNNIWSRYRNYYEKIGVSRAVISRICEYDTYKEKLFTQIFDVDGTEPTPEEAVRGYYAENYVAFMAVNGYFSRTGADGRATPLSGPQREELKKRFQDYAARINAGADISAINAEYMTGEEDAKTPSVVEPTPGAGTEEASTTGAQTGADASNPDVFSGPAYEVKPAVLFKNGTNYPPGFFDAVYAMKNGVASVPEFTDYIYIVQRVDVFGPEDSFYAQNRGACLKALKWGDFEAEITAWGAGFKIEKNDKALNDFAAQAINKM